MPRPAPDPAPRMPTERERQTYASLRRMEAAPSASANERQIAKRAADAMAAAMPILKTWNVPPAKPRASRPPPATAPAPWETADVVELLYRFATGAKAGAASVRLLDVVDRVELVVTEHKDHDTSFSIRIPSRVVEDLLAAPALAEQTAVTVLAAALRAKMQEWLDSVRD